MTRYRRLSVALDLAWLVYSLRQMPGGRELLEEKKRQLRLEGDLKGGENNAILQDMPELRISP